MNLRKDWRVWLPPIGFGCAFGVMYLLDHRALWLLLGVFALLELFTGYLLVMQRKTMALQHKNIMDAIKMLAEVSGELMVCTWNLQRARAELENAGIEFQMLTPPTAADKETLS